MIGLPELAPILGPLAGTLTRASVKRIQRLWPWLQGYRDKISIEAVIRAEAVRDHPLLYAFLQHHLEAFPALAGGKSAKLMSRKLDNENLLMPVTALWVGEKVSLGRLEVGDVFEEEGWETTEYIRNQRLFGRTINNWR